MSTLASITVMSCDSCSEIAVLQTDDDFASFEANWYDGWELHFCPACSRLPRNAAAIRVDRKNQKAFNDAVKTGFDTMEKEIQDGH